MKKSSRKSKSAGKSTRRKSAPRPKKTSAKKRSVKATAIPRRRTATKKTRPAKAAAPSVAAAGLLAADPKLAAVVSCVNQQMDAARPGWNDNGKMDTDYHYNQFSMPAFLSVVRACLQQKHYNFNMNDPAFIQACVTSTVYRLKRRVYDRTTP